MLHKILYNSFFQATLGLLILLNKSLVNGYPLLQASTDRLIFSAFKNTVLNDQEGFYVLFVKYGSLSLSLWFIVIFQGVLLLYGLNRIYKIHLNDNKVVKFLCLIMLVFLSSIDYYVSLISPHIFSLLSLIYAYLIIRSNKSLFFHLSILLICLIIVPIQALIILILGVIYLLLCFLWKWQKRFLKSSFLVAISLIAITLVCLLNKKFEGSYYYLKNANIHLVAKAFDRQIATEFLKEKCTEGPYSIGSINVCETKEYMSYLSEHKFKYNENSPLFMGECLNSSYKECWSEKREDFKYFISDLKQNNKYLNQLRLAWLSSAIKQLFSYEQKPLSKKNFKNVIKTYYPNDLASLNSSLQTKRYISFTLDNLIEVVVVFISFLFFLYKSFTTHKKYLIYFIIIFGSLFLNAFIVTYFQSYSPHYQGRIISIVSIAMIIVFCKSSFFNSLIIKLSEYK